MKQVDINSIAPAAYNPRETDPRRIELIKLSLRKLGFVVPIYINSNNGILSGHQRQIAAKQLGWDTVPVDEVSIDCLDSEMKINIAFNRGTNDFNKKESTIDLAQYLFKNNERIEALSQKLKDVDPANRMPCLNTKSVDVELLKTANRASFDEGARNGYASLYEMTKVVQPLIITPDYKIVNGIGRFFYCMSRGVTDFDCVLITEEQAEFADLMMNKLTMDFEFESKFGDVLRYNSFRRASGTRTHLGMAYTIGVTGGNSVDIDIYNPVDKRRWMSVYGKTIFDFGAGLMDECRILNAIGIKVVPFEPFVLKGTVGEKGFKEELDVEKARGLTQAFLDEVQQGICFDSVVSQTILNSIPFKKDRVKYLILLSFLCDAETTAFIGTNSATSSMNSYVFEDGKKSDSAVNVKKFRVEYEPNTTIGDISKNPKVQKYHTIGEMKDLISPYFKEVKMINKHSKIYAICKSPTYRFTKGELIEAIDFEFNLPYPNGQRLDMHQKAKLVFLERAKKIGFH